MGASSSNGSSYTSVAASTGTNATDVYKKYKNKKKKVKKGQSDDTLPRYPRDRSRISVRVKSFVRKLNTLGKPEKIAGDEFRPQLPDVISSKNPLWMAYSSRSEEEKLPRGSEITERERDSTDLYDRTISVDTLTTQDTRNESLSSIDPDMESSDSAKNSPVSNAIPTARVDNEKEADTFINFISQLGGTPDSRLEKKEDNELRFKPTPPKHPPPKGAARAWTPEPLSFRSTQDINDVNNYYYSTLKLTHEEHIAGAVKMILSFVNEDVIRPEIMHSYPEEVQKSVENFVVSVSERYTKTSYHGFHHAVDVMQMMYLLINNFLEKKLSKAEPFFLLITSLCHDVGHQGANNAFLRQHEDDNFCQKFGSTSMLELFHVEQLCEIVDSSALFSPRLMKSHVKEEFKGLAKDLIKATDMETHKETMKQFILAVKNRRAQKLEKHRSKAFHTWSMSRTKKIVVKNDNEGLPTEYLALAMKLCDIANVIRDFEDAREWARLLTFEFEAMGTVENNDPTKLIEQQQRCEEPRIEDLAKLTLGFMVVFAIPMARSFEAVSKAASEFILTEMLMNMQTWLALVQSSADL